jgi:hypothetical protein
LRERRHDIAGVIDKVTKRAGQRPT